MIVPDGAKLILDPRDEHMHEPEPFSNYNESMYFNAFDAAQAIGLWVRIGNRPNEGHAEVTCCLYLPDGRVGFMYARPKIADNRALDAGGMRFGVETPFEHLKISYDGDILLLTEPRQMADPGHAFKSNPKAACHIRLDVHGVSPMHGGEIVAMDGSPWPLDPATAVFRGHLEQHTRVAGTIVVGDETHAINGFGFRDKSWGPRFWQNFYWYKWLPITFDPDFGLMLALMGRKDGPPVVNGHVFVDGALEPLVDAQVEADYDSDHYQRRVVARLHTAKRTFVLEGEIVSLVPLRHRRTTPDGLAETTRITEGMTRYRCEGREALGMSEFLDLIVEGGVPISIAGGR